MTRQETIETKDTFYKGTESGKLLHGELKETQTENHKFKWITVLALLSDDGQWLDSEHWKLNQRSQAIKTLLNSGWAQGSIKGSYICPDCGNDCAGECDAIKRGGYDY